jgi:hypothetical protein
VGSNLSTKSESQDLALSLPGLSGDEDDLQKKLFQLEKCKSMPENSKDEVGSA